MKKKVLIDLKFLSFINNGFGQLCLYYGNFFKENAKLLEDANLEITLYVPKEYIGRFGDNIKYLEVSRKYKFYPFLFPHFDIWHSTTQITKFISISSKTNRIITIHDLNVLYDEPKLKKRRKKMKDLQVAIKMADKLVAISHFTEKEIRDHLEIGKLPIELNYIGIRDFTQDEIEQPQQVDTSKKYFFTIGHVLRKKNFHVLLDMMKLMPEYNLYIVGVDSDEYADEIRHKIKEDKIQNVFLTGPISHAEKVWMYKNCYGFFFPSLFEGFGAPIIEAMRFDKPVFSSRCTSLPEIGGDYAFFWDHFYPEHMKNVVEENIEKFYSDEQFRQAQKEYAFSFSIDRHMKNYIEIYKTMPIVRKRNLIKWLSNTYKYYVKKGVF